MDEYCPLCKKGNTDYTLSPEEKKELTEKNIELDGQEKVHLKCLMLATSSEVA